MTFKRRFTFTLARSLETRVQSIGNQEVIPKDNNRKLRPPPCSQQELRKLVKYDPDTGLFITNFVTKGRPDIKLGTPIGSKNVQGYITISVKGKRYKAHKLANYYMTGKWEQVDHKDTIRDNNKWLNLRPATEFDNQRNKNVRSNQKYPKGVTKNKNYYRARISIGYKRITLGNFKTPELAHMAYCKAAKLLHGEYARF